MKNYLRNNVESFNDSIANNSLDAQKNYIFSEPSIDLRVQIEFSAQLMAVNPKEKSFLVTIKRFGNVEIEVYFMWVKKLYTIKKETFIVI